MLTRDNITLRPLDDDDKEQLALLANNKKVWDNLRDLMPYPYTIDNAIFFISLAKQEDPLLTFAIEFDGQLAGIIGLFPQQDVYKKTAEIGYWIGEPFWNKGIATKAVKLMTDYAFDQLGFIRIHTGVFEYNLASMKVLEKCGYKKDGVFEKAIIKNDQVWDEHRFSIVKHGSR